MTEPVPHPYEKTQKTIAMYVLFFIFVDRKCENGGFETEHALIYLGMQFWFVGIFHRLFKFATFP